MPKKGPSQREKKKKKKRLGGHGLSLFWGLHSIEEQVFFSKLAKLPRVEGNNDSKSIGALVKYPGCVPGRAPPLHSSTRLSRRGLVLVWCLCCRPFSLFFFFFPSAVFPCPMALLSTKKPMKQAALTTVLALSMPMWRSSLLFLGLKLHILTWTIGFGESTPESFLTRGNPLAAGNVHQVGHATSEGGKLVENSRLVSGGKSSPAWNHNMDPRLTL